MCELVSIKSVLYVGRLDADICAKISREGEFVTSEAQSLFMFNFQFSLT